MTEQILLTIEPYMYGEGDRIEKSIFPGQVLTEVQRMPAEEFYLARCIESKKRWIECRGWKENGWAIIHRRNGRSYISAARFDSLKTVSTVMSEFIQGKEEWDSGIEWKRYFMIGMNFGFELRSLDPISAITRILGNLPGGRTH